MSGWLLSHPLYDMTSRSTVGREGTVINETFSASRALARRTGAPFPPDWLRREVKHGCVGRQRVRHGAFCFFLRRSAQAASSAGCFGRRRPPSAPASPNAMRRPVPRVSYALCQCLCLCLSPVPVFRAGYAWTRLHAM